MNDVLDAVLGGMDLPTLAKFFRIVAGVIAEKTGLPVAHVFARGLIAEIGVSAGAELLGAIEDGRVEP